MIFLDARVNPALSSVKSLVRRATRGWTMSEVFAVVLEDFSFGLDFLPCFFTSFNGEVEAPIGITAEDELVLNGWAGEAGAGGGVFSLAAAPLFALFARLANCFSKRNEEI